MVYFSIIIVVYFSIIIYSYKRIIHNFLILRAKIQYLLELSKFE